MPHLASLTIYPFKSLDGMPVSEAQVLPSGALAGDRQFAIVDEAGAFVNAKRCAAIHRIRSDFDLDQGTVQLWTDAGGQGLHQSQRAVFHIDAQRRQLEDWLSEFFGASCRVVSNRQYGFPDDTQAAGPTVITTATLREVAGWFPGWTLAEARRRFRANLELAGDDGDIPFWEDRLYGETGLGVRFRVGDIEFLGTNPCARCVGPTRSPDTGEPNPEISKAFTRRRRESLPPWAAASRFDHFYRLAVNTRLNQPSETMTLRVGDPVFVVP
jgi:uncharacterized protein YcbX